MSWACRGDRTATDEAHALAIPMIEAGRARGLAVHEGRGRWMLERLHHCHGHMAEAEREIFTALPLLAGAPLDQLAATVTLASIDLADNRVDDALAGAEKAIHRYEELHAFGHRGALARLVHAEILHAAGQHESARRAIAIAKARLLANAEKVGSPNFARSFLQHVPANARTLDLAQQWLGEREDEA